MGELQSRLAQDPAAEGPRGEFGDTVRDPLAGCDLKWASPLCMC